MERRRTKRFPRRISIRVTLGNPPKTLSAYSTNISAGGMFIATDQVQPVGTRLKIDLTERTYACTVEAVVVKSKAVPIELRSVQQAGMGVRFLPVPELIRPFLPPGGELEIPAGPGAPETRPPADDGVYRVRFPSAAMLEQTIRSDVKNGALFVETARLAPVDQLVTIQFLFPAPEPPSAAFQARVVHRSEPKEGSSPALPVGIGVQFVDRPAVVVALQAIANRLKATPGG